MFTQDEVQNLAGATAYDQAGQKVGQVATVYQDQATGEPEWLTVNTGLFGMKETFVPLALARVRDESGTKRGGYAASGTESSVRLRPGYQQLHRGALHVALAAELPRECLISRGESAASGSPGSDVPADYITMTPDGTFRSGVPFALYVRSLGWPDRRPGTVPRPPPARPGTLRHEADSLSVSDLAAGDTDPSGRPAKGTLPDP